MMKNKILDFPKVKIIFSLFLFLFPPFSTSAQTWQPQISGIGNSLNSVFFLDEFNGWAVGSLGSIIHTTDGGENWNQQSSGTNKDLNCVYFVDTLIGWMCGYQGTILKTTDGGNSWTPQNSFTVSNLLSIDFFNESTGWVVGVGGTILKTTNGGANWVSQNSPFPEIISDVDFVDSLYGWAATYASGSIETTIIKTTDGGNLWELITVPMLIPLPAFSIDFIDRNTGWIVGFYETIYKSIDGGNNWFEQLFGLVSSDGFLSVSFVDENNGWTVGYEGVIANTSDGGNLWSAQNSGTTNILWDVYFVNRTTGWAVGDNGLILKYSIPVSVDDKNQGLTPIQFSLEQNYPNPFNPSTTIQYSIPEGGNVKLLVYNSLGEEVAVLADEYKDAGNYNIKFNASKLPSGIYFYKLKMNSSIETKKMILLR